jgi:tripartite-type tricarboxylate transporter receptor subunit TctC
MVSHSLITIGAAALALGFASAPVPAQEKYPDRPIRLVVPFSPGGETDLIGRLWAQKVTPHLGGSIVIENRPGGGGSVATAEVARAKPDGYTLLSGTTSTHVVNPVATSSPTYDPVRDFTPIAVVSTTPTSMLVHPAVPAKNLPELVALIKANPGKYSYGSAGHGTMTNLTGELFKLLAGGLDLVHVPYKGGGPALQDLVAGHIAVATMILSTSVIGHHRAGRLRILAVNSEARVKAAPDIPTAIESGLPGMKVVVFNAIFAPAGTPPAAIEALSQATAKAKADETFARDLEQGGAEMVGDSDPENASRFIREEAARWTPIVKATGFKIE